MSQAEKKTDTSKKERTLVSETRTNHFKFKLYHFPVAIFFAAYQIIMHLTCVLMQLHCPGEKHWLGHSVCYKGLLWFSFFNVEIWPSKYLGFTAKGDFFNTLIEGFFLVV